MLSLSYSLLDVDAVKRGRSQSIRRCLAESLLPCSSQHVYKVTKHIQKTSFHIKRYLKQQNIHNHSIPPPPPRVHFVYILTHIYSAVGPPEYPAIHPA
jgi:hypothetical protein